MTKSRLSAIVTSHGRANGFIEIITDLANQSLPPDEVIVLYSCIPAIIMPADLPFEVRLQPVQEDRQDWGHQKRSDGLVIASCDYIGFFNDDDSYEADYVEKMITALQGRDGFAYCYWDICPCEPRGCSSTSGNFIVSRGIALDTGGWSERNYEADAHFIDRCVAYCRRHELPVACVPEVLYHHNVR